jgi:hypothetical protein
VLIEISVAYAPESTKVDPSSTVTSSEVDPLELRITLGAVVSTT